jgi:hypothetical protein
MNSYPSKISIRLLANFHLGILVPTKGHIGQGPKFQGKFKRMEMIHPRSRGEAQGVFSLPREGKPFSRSRGGRLCRPQQKSPFHNSRQIGLPHSPTIIDVRDDQDFATDPRLIPGSRRRDFGTVASWSQL